MALLPSDCQLTAKSDTNDPAASAFDQPGGASQGATSRAMSSGASRSAPAPERATTARVAEGASNPPPNVAAPEEFGRQVQDLLPHLHDYVYLQNHALCARFFPDPALEGPHRAQRLRRVVLETIEELSPPAESSPSSREWRNYQVLASRYVEGLEIQAIVNELAISERQYYREQTRAVMALCSLLWEKLRWLEEHRAAGQRPAARERAGPVGQASHGATGDLVAGVEERPSQAVSREAGLLAPEAEPLSLGELIEGVLRALRPLVEQCGKAIACDLERANAPVVASRTLVRQILIGVLSRYLADSSVTAMSIALQPGRWQVQVALIGATDRPRTDHPDLKDIRRLVETARGEWLGVEAKGTQCAVRFSLPTSQPRVLLAVDDNPVAVRLLRRYLAQEDYQVLHAPNGGEALRMAHELRPDVVTLDIMLPRQDGWELLQALRGDAATQSIPVVICSVLEEPQLASALGANAYLKKPFTQRQLLDVLERTLPA